jgi:hypothetical protein
MQSISSRNARSTALAAAIAIPLALALAGCGEKITAAKEAAQKTADAAKAVSQIDTKKLEEASKKMEEASKQLEAAQKSGDGKAAADAMKAMTGAMAGASGGTVDFREMRALLPETLGSLKRVSVEGSKNNAMGIAAATAKATYEAENADPNNMKRVRAEMTDIAGLGPMAAMAFAWANVEIDKETQSGYEKTTTFNGMRAMEKFHKNGKRSELDLMVADRFIVKLEGDNMEMAEFKTLVGAIDIKKLASLKPQAAEVASKN